MNLIIRPAVNFEEGTRYVVALRNMKDATGQLIRRSDAFRVYRDKLPTADAAIEARRPHMEDLFATLEQAGHRAQRPLPRLGLHGREPAQPHRARAPIRDDAFATARATPTSPTSPSRARRRRSRSRGPATTATAARRPPPDPPTGAVHDRRGQPHRAPRRGHGHGALLPGRRRAARRARSSRSLPGSTVPAARSPATRYSANFICNIPRVDDRRRRPSHRRARRSTGTACSARRARSTRGNVKAMAHEHNFIFCATDWVGFSTRTCRTSLTILQDLSQLPDAVDRMQQGFLNFMFLGRLLIHPDGFAADPAFQDGRRRVADRHAPASSTTATARAGSWAARSPRSRPTSSAASSACRG